MRYEIQYLQAVEPEALPRDQGVTVFIHDELDNHGFNEVTISSDDRDRLIEYAREQWGDEDADWFNDRIVNGVVDTTNRTILVHLNIELPWSEELTAAMLADAITAEIQGVLEVGVDQEQTPILASGKTVVALAEEV